MPSRPAAFVIASIFAMAAARLHAAPVVHTEIGTLQGAGYRIDVPADWNQKLVVYFHGYEDRPLVFGKRDALSSMLAPMLGRGYAIIQSGYSQGGWAVQQASADTERLRALFIARHGKPKQSILLGMSMGGALAALTLEGQPRTYAGALSICGAVAPSDALMARALALRAAFDYYFPGLLGELVPVPDSYRNDGATVSKIAAALHSRPAALNALLRWYGAADVDDLAPVIAFAGDALRELQHRAHGNPVSNVNLVYTGSGDDAALNEGVRRYRAEPEAAAYLARWYTPTGKLLDPMLELHDTGDPLVPASSTFEYALAVQRAGHGGNFVQQYVEHEGHCVFTSQQVGEAFAELEDWIGHGRRPQPGRLP